MGVNDDRGSTFLKRYPNLWSEFDDLNLTKNTLLITEADTFWESKN